MIIEILTIGFVLLILLMAVALLVVMNRDEKRENVPSCYGKYSGIADPKCRDCPVWLRCANTLYRR